MKRNILRLLVLVSLVIGFLKIEFILVERFSPDIRVKDPSSFNPAVLSENQRAMYDEIISGRSVEEISIKEGKKIYLIEDGEDWEVYKDLDFIRVKYLLARGEAEEILYADDLNRYKDSFMFNNISGRDFVLLTHHFHKHIILMITILCSVIFYVLWNKFMENYKKDLRFDNRIGFPMFSLLFIFSIVCVNHFYWPYVVITTVFSVSLAVYYKLVIEKCADDFYFESKSDLDATPQSS